MRERLRRFMSGRYGSDQFTRFLSIIVLITCAVMLFVRTSPIAGRIVSLIGWALLFYSLFRTFSRNYAARSEENRKYLAIKYKITSRFNLLKRQIKDRKTHKYVSCPQCGKNMRVPRGKGKIRITCPNCANTFIKNT